MNLAIELENDLALAFLVEKRHSERLDSNDVILLLDQIREALMPLSESDGKIDRFLVVPNAGEISAH